MDKIVINPFVRRQTRDSEFSYFDGSDEELLVRIKESWKRQSTGYRDGVILVNIQRVENFYTGIVRLQPGDPLIGEFKARQEGELPVKQIRAVYGDKTPAKVVEVVMYNANVLKEDGSNTIDHGWEVISINARATKEEAPISVGALLRNYFCEPGGTDTKMTVEEFVDALRKSHTYWRDKILIASKE